MARGEEEGQRGALTPLSTAILLALADADRHGYAILKEIESLSNGEMQPKTGSLYLALQRLAEEGLIEETVGAETEDARRRYYGLTAAGRMAVRAEAVRLARLVEVAARKRLIARALLPIAVEGS